MSRICTIKSPVISSFSSNLPVRALKLISWVVSSKSGILETLQYMRDEGIHTVTVIDENGSVVGLVTESKSVVVFGKKKTKKNLEVLDECWAKCEAACVNKGGCLVAHIHYDKKGNAKCVGYTCQDDIGVTETLEIWF